MRAALSRTHIAKAGRLGSGPALGPNIQTAKSPPMAGFEGANRAALTA